MSTNTTTSTNDDCDDEPADSTPLHDLIAIQRDFLKSVEALTGPDGGPKGLEIKDYIEVFYADEVNTARLYTNLDSLVEKGLIEKGKHDERTNEYTLTSRGRRELDAHRTWFDLATEVGE